MKRVTAFILAGGEGQRMSPLTDAEAKPAVLFGGGFRLIDFALMNCARSGVGRAIALVQHHSETLLSHLRNPPREVIGQVNLRTVQPDLDDRFLGTADAVRKNLRFADWTVDHVLIIPADMVYRMDFSRMLEFHQANQADLTMATLQIPREEASRYGVVQIDADGRVEGYEDLPNEPKAVQGQGDRSLVSMGIYLFKREVLNQLLMPAGPSLPLDFSRDVFPSAVSEYQVLSYEPAVHDVSNTTYWRDIATLEDFWRANMEFLDQWGQLLKEEGGALLPRGVVYVKNGFDGRVVNSLIPAHLELLEGEIRNSVLAANVQIKGRVQIVDSIVLSGAVIEDGCEVRKAILDQDSRLTGEARVDPRRNRPGSQIRTLQGLTVVPRGVLVRGPAKIPRPCASMPREDRRASFLG